MNGLTEEQLLFRNLKDSGCDDDSIRQFLKLKKEGREKELMRLLSATGQTCWIRSIRVSIR